VLLAKHLGAHVVAAAGSAEKCERLKEIGADEAINYRSQDFAAEVKRLTDGKGVELILDMVGGPYIPRNYEAAGTDGRIVQIAFLQGSKVEVNFMRLMLKRLTHTGSTLRSRSVAEKAAIARELEQHVWPLLSTASVQPVVHRTLPLREAAEAHRLLESGEVIGKIVLTTGLSL
jgi:NADPH2:quinone reductase